MKARTIGVLFAVLLGLAPAAHALDPLPRTLVYDAATVSALLQEGYSASAGSPSRVEGSIVFYDPGYSVEQLRAHPALQGKVKIDALTHLADGQPWYVGHAFARKTDAPQYRTVRIEESSDPRYVLVLEGGTYTSARVVSMLYAVHMLATDGGRLTKGAQWAATYDVTASRWDCLAKRVYVAYSQQGFVLESLYYSPRVLECYPGGPVYANTNCFGSYVQLQQVQQGTSAPCCGQQVPPYQKSQPALVPQQVPLRQPAQQPKAEKLPVPDPVSAPGQPKPVPAQT